MANKYLRPRYSTLKVNKLDKLAKNLQTSLGASDFFTQEQYLEEAIKVLTTFYQTLTSPVLDEDVRPQRGSLPNSDLYNQMLEDIKDNLDVVFSEFENLESLVVANFNYAVTGANRMNARLKRVASLVGDYILYSENAGDLILFRDSFDNSDKLALGSSLLNTNECSLDQNEGVVTLPIDVEHSVTIPFYRSPVIKEYAGAVYGNNYEIGAEWHGDISSIIDNNPDTWFEYEKVVRAENDTGEPLVMDLMLQMSKPGVINHIRVNPNNFGTRTVVQIEKIETSFNGVDFISIKDDIPIAGYLAEDEENIFSLAPPTSKYAGQGIYTFTPRKAKYVHLVLSQADPYIIDTTSGQRLRYAIGIRDIEAQALSYLEEGEIISRPYSTAREVSKVALMTNQAPIENSQLASIDHHVSVDNGASWHQIQPQQQEGEAGVVASVPEILNFNNAADNSLATAQPVTSVMWKALLKRNNSAFEEGGTALHKSTAFKSELHDVPHAAPHSIDLTESPLEGTVQVVDPLFGSRGVASLEYRLSSSTSENEYFLPADWQGLEPPSEKTVLSGVLYDTVRMSASDWMHIFVNNKEWLPKTLGSTHEDFSDYDVESEVYAIDWNEGILYFGDGHTYGKSPGDSRVALRFDAERIAPVDGPGVPVSLMFQSAPDKKLVKIKRYGEITNGTTAVPRGATIFRLQHRYIDTVLTTMPGTEKSFANGRDEFTGNDQWSIDKRAGVVYLSSPSSSLRAITYTYQPVYELAKDDWDWADKGGLRDSVTISDTAWETISQEHDMDPLPSIPSGYEHVIHLPNLSVVKKTLRVSATVPSGVNNPFVEEVPFVDGRQELSSIIQTTEDIAALTTTPVTTVSLSEDIVEDSAYGVTFDGTARDYFVTEKASGVVVGDSEGTYYIDRDNNQVQVRVSSSVESPGKISYFYTKPEVKTGLYSVDYAGGRIFTQEPIGSLSGINVEYEYADYRIEYPIARLVDPSDYEVDYAEGTITFDSPEVLSEYRVSKALPNRYEVSYDYIKETREDVASLRDHFTPVVKDYVLKLVPKE